MPDMGELVGKGGNGNAAVPFLVSAEVAYAIIAAACSSPQTTELNADKRAETLMKWVWIGIGQTTLLVGIAAYLAYKTGHPVGPVVTGAAMGSGLMLASYWHARDAGLSNPGQPTETY